MCIRARFIIYFIMVQVTSHQGRGRLFVREALQHRLLVNTIELLADNLELMQVRTVIFVLAHH